MDYVEHFADGRVRLVLLAELAARLVALVAFGGIDCLLLYVTDNDSLDLGTCLSISRHKATTLVSQLTTHISHCVPAVEFAGMGSRMHHKVLLWQLSAADGGARARGQSTGLGLSQRPAGALVPFESVCFRHDVDHDWRMLWQKCFIINLLPLVQFAHLRDRSARDSLWHHVVCRSRC